MVTLNKPSSGDTDWTTEINDNWTSIENEANGVRSVSTGGTGTSTQFTAGSIVFAGTSGVYSQDNSNLSWNDSLDRLTIGTGSLTVNGKAGQENVFNESGVDQDFRIEGDTDGNLFFVDASADKVGIGTASPGGKFSVVHAATDPGTTTYAFSAQHTLTVTSSAINNAYGMIVNLINIVGSGVSNSGTVIGISNSSIRNNASDLGSIGTVEANRVEFGHSTVIGGATVTTASYGIHLMPSNGAGTITTQFCIAIDKQSTGGTLTTSYGLYIDPPLGTTTHAIYVTAGQITFNNGGGDYDLRAAGDNKSNCLLLDASDDEVAIDGRFSLVALTPAQITSNQNDYNPESTATNRASFWRISSDAARTITGIANGLNGRVLVLANVGSFAITLSNQSASSTAANRIITGTGADLSVAADQTVVLIYDTTTSRWRIVKNA